ncbi:hypothetical protein WEH80_10565 [Actinomycetes bacterium KLBMP 9759]
MTAEAATPATGRDEELSGPAGEAQYTRLAAAVDEHRPVLDLFRNTTPVTTTLVTG